MEPIFTIGHSLHSIETFLELLQLHRIDAVADIRSHPYSKRFPHFSKGELQLTLRAAGIRYVFLGVELGARREERSCYVEGQARYEQIARLPAFAEGLSRLKNGAANTRIALMCAEKDPLTCHRTILVTRHLCKMGIAIQHIREDGKLESNSDAENRLMLEEGFSPGQMDIFGGGDVQQSLELAYEKRGRKIAYKETDGDDEIIHDRVYQEIG